MVIPYMLRFLLYSSYSLWLNFSKIKLGARRVGLSRYAGAQDRGFAGCLLELKWLPLLPIFLGFSHFFLHFEGQQSVSGIRHYSDLIANQARYAFQHVLSYVHNED